MVTSVILAQNARTRAFGFGSCARVHLVLMRWLDSITEDDATHSHAFLLPLCMVVALSTDTGSAILSVVGSVHDDFSLLLFELPPCLLTSRQS